MTNLENNPDCIKLHSKKDRDLFFKNHDPEICNLNSENYGGTIELIFCKDHNVGPGPYRPLGTYIFIDSSEK